MIMIVPLNNSIPRLNYSSLINKWKIRNVRIIRLLMMEKEKANLLLRSKIKRIIWHYYKIMCLRSRMNAC